MRAIAVPRSVKARATEAAMEWARMGCEVEKLGVRRPEEICKTLATQLEAPRTVTQQAKRKPMRRARGARSGAESRKPMAAASAEKASSGLIRFPLDWRRRPKEAMSHPLTDKRQTTPTAMRQIRSKRSRRSSRAASGSFGDRAGLNLGILE